MNNIPVFKFKEFWVEEGEIFGSKKEFCEIKNGFYISYFDGSLQEKFLHKREKCDINNNVIGHLFVSQNGNRVTVIF